MRTYIALSIALIVGGCVSPIKQARHEREAKQCEAFGYEPGTDAYANCRMQFEMQHKRNMADIGNSIAQASQQRPTVYSPPPPTNCMSRQSYPGGPVYTNCF